MEREFSARVTMKDVRDSFTVRERLFLGLAALECEVRSTRDFAVSIYLALSTSDYLLGEARKLSIIPAVLSSKVGTLSMPTGRLLLKVLRDISGTHTSDLAYKGGFQDVLRLHGLLDVPEQASIGLAVVRLPNGDVVESALDRRTYRLALSRTSPFDIMGASSQVFSIAREALEGTAPPSKMKHMNILLHLIAAENELLLLRLEEGDRDFRVIPLDERALRYDLVEGVERRYFIEGVNAPLFNK